MFILELEKNCQMLIGIRYVKSYSLSRLHEQNNFKYKKLDI